MLSKPFGYMETDEISAIINGPPKRKPGRPRKTPTEDEA